MKNLINNFAFVLKYFIVVFPGMSHGLALLAAYDQDSSDNEEEPPKKKVKLQNPLKNIKIGDEESEEIIDDPSLHDYRSRSFPHVRGNWATYAFIKTDQDWSQLQSRLKTCLAKQDIIAQDILEPHLSVSKVVTLQHHWIQPFVQAFQAKLKSRLVPFKLNIGQAIKVLVNEDLTRTFITVQVQSHKYLNEVVKCCDEVLDEYKKEPFYDPPEFHVSLLWTLGNQKSVIDVKALEQVLEHIDPIEVDLVHCKIGNKIFSLNL